LKNVEKHLDLQKNKQFLNKSGQVLLFDKKQ